MLYASLMSVPVASEVFIRFTEIFGGRFISEINSGDTLYMAANKYEVRIPYEQDITGFLDLRESITMGKIPLDAVLNQYVLRLIEVEVLSSPKSNARYGKFEI